MVMPPLAALLSDPSWQMLSDEGPFLGSMQLHQLHEQRILALGPRAFLALLAIEIVLHDIRFMLRLRQLVIFQHYFLTFLQGVHDDLAFVACTPPCALPGRLH
jgi:hypothetical protein